MVTKSVTGDSLVDSSGSWAILSWSPPVSIMSTSEDAPILPLARVKKIAKNAPDVKTISTNGNVMIAKATVGYHDYRVHQCSLDSRNSSLARSRRTLTNILRLARGRL